MKEITQIKDFDMKKSVSKKISIRILILLIIASIILFTGSFFTVFQVISDKNKHYSQAILSVFTDLLVQDSKKNQEPIDLDHTDLIQYYGDYFCTWYSVDYIMVGIPNIEDDTITIYSACRKERDDREDFIPFENHWNGMTTTYDLNEEEKAVWRGDQLFATSDQNLIYGHEFVTMMRLEDAFGNKMMAAVTISYQDVYLQVISSFSIFALIILIVLFGVYFTARRILRKRVSDPVRQISGVMKHYVSDGKMSTEKLDDSGDDEFAMISKAFNNMTDNISTYLDDIHSLTQEQERQSTEYEIAASIQNGLLPEREFKTSHFDIHAFMKPAKNIGGDLYDYMPLDDHRTLLVMGDVSGKGIPASIFMSVTLILIRQYARLNLAPSEILRRTNDSLCEKNPAMLFATVFVGIYDSRTKQLVYANAGHNLPYIVHQDVKPLEGKTGLLLGLYPGETYPQSTLRLSMGDTLFLYTDGVTETVNGDHEFYDESRLEKALSVYHTLHKPNMVDFINEELDAYSQEAEQHDDVTMLAFTVKETKELFLNVDLQEIRKIKNAILTLPLSRAGQLDLCLAAEEWFDNIFYYAYEDRPASTEKVRLILSCSDKIVMTFESGGKPFDPISNLNPPVDYDPDTQIGGLGNFIAFAGVDDVKYQYRDQKNVLSFIKFIEENHNEDHNRKA